MSIKCLRNWGSCTSLLTAMIVSGSIGRFLAAKRQARCNSATPYSWILTIETLSLRRKSRPGANKSRPRLGGYHLLLQSYRQECETFQCTSTRTKLRRYMGWCIHIDLYGKRFWRSWYDSSILGHRSQQHVRRLGMVRVLDVCMDRIFAIIGIIRVFVDIDVFRVCIIVIMPVQKTGEEIVAILARHCIRDAEKLGFPIYIFTVAPRISLQSY